MLCLYCSQVSHIPPIFTMELFGKPPWWADGACREENKAKTWALYTAHTFPHFQASFCKREQQRSSGNLTMGLFWKTRLFIGAFLYAAATVNTVDTGDWRRASSPHLLKWFQSLWSSWFPSWMWCVHYLTPLSMEQKDREAFEFTGKAYLRMLVNSVLLSREWGNATVCSYGCLRSRPHCIEENLAAGKPGVLRWVCTC